MFTHYPTLFCFTSKDRCRLSHLKNPKLKAMFWQFSLLLPLPGTTERHFRLSRSPVNTPHPHLTSLFPWPFEFAQSAPKGPDRHPENSRRDKAPRCNSQQINHWRQRFPATCNIKGPARACNNGLLSAENGCTGPSRKYSGRPGEVCTCGVGPASALTVMLLERSCWGEMGEAGGLRWFWLVCSFSSVF